MSERLTRGSETLPEYHEINVTPFIDVMLVLLIIFMVAVPLATLHIPVQLPASNAAAQPPPTDPLTVTLHADLSLRVNEEAVMREALGAALARLAPDEQDEPVFLRADRAVPYGEIMGVLDELRAAGYRRVALVGLAQEAP